MEDSTRMFRKAAFGGFNKEDVIDYIESMKREFFNYKTKVEHTIQELNEKLAELESAAETVETATPSLAAQEENAAVSNINEATDHLKQVADSICVSLRQFLDKFTPAAEEIEPPAAPVEAPAETEALPDPVAQILSTLYAAKNVDPPAPESETKPQRSMIASVLPNYLFSD